MKGHARQTLITMKIFQTKFFPLFGISAAIALTLTIGFFCYKVDKLEREWRRTIEHMARQDSLLLQTETTLLEPLAAMLITTNLVHRPCQCGFCRPSEGIAVLEHINAIGFDTFVEVSTNFLPIVKTPMPGQDSNYGSIGGNAL